MDPMGKGLNGIITKSHLSLPKTDEGGFCI